MGSHSIACHLTEVILTPLSWRIAGTHLSTWEWWKAELTWAQWMNSWLRTVTQRYHRCQSVLSSTWLEEFSDHLLTYSHRRRVKFLFGDLQSGGLGYRSPPVVSRGKAPVGVWGQSPLKMKYNVTFSLWKNRLTAQFRHPLLLFVECNIYVLL